MPVPGTTMDLSDLTVRPSPIGRNTTIGLAKQTKKEPSSEEFNEKDLMEEAIRKLNEMIQDKTDLTCPQESDTTGSETLSHWSKETDQMVQNLNLRNEDYFKALLQCNKEIDSFMDTAMGLMDCAMSMKRMTEKQIDKIASTRKKPKRVNLDTVMEEDCVDYWESNGYKFNLEENMDEILEKMKHG